MCFPLTALESMSDVFFDVLFLFDATNLVDKNEFSIFNVSRMKQNFTSAATDYVKL